MNRPKLTYEYASLIISFQFHPIDQEYERSSNPEYHNGRKTKKIRGNFGETEIEVPQDRDGSFEPKVVKKRQKVSKLWWEI